MGNRFDAETKKLIPILPQEENLRSLINNDERHVTTRGCSIVVTIRWDEKAQPEMSTSASDAYELESETLSEASDEGDDTGLEFSDAVDDTNDRGRQSNLESDKEPNDGEQGAKSERSKRKRSRSAKFWRVAEARARAKRLRSSYSVRYNDLYNREVGDATSGLDTFPPKRYRWKGSTFGVSEWSPEEKDRFFAALDRKGKDNLKAIAAAVRTKSVPEVQTLIQLLHEGVVQEEDSDRYRLPEYAEIPAACEISNECTKALEDSADALALKQFERDVEVERERHGDYWLLNLEAVQRLDEKRDGEQDQQGSHSQLEAACELLDLRELVELSFRLYMNSKDRDYNWQQHAERGEGPSIFCTAFLDLYSLVVGITKRLVSSCLFLAASRIRAFEDLRKKPGKAKVRVRDVHAALEVLGFKHNRSQYWRGVASRCNLRVYEDFESALEGHDELSLSDVERRLAWPLDGVPSVSRPASPESPGRDASSESLSSLGSPIPLSADETQLEQGDTLLQIQDKGAEYNDAKSNWTEELRLWDLLGADPRVQAPALLGSSPPKKQLHRKAREDLVDWREWIQYRSEWEAFDELPKQEAFDRNRRRILSRRVAKSSSVSTDSSIEEDAGKVAPGLKRELNSESDEEDDSAEEAHSDSVTTRPDVPRIEQRERGAKGSGEDESREHFQVNESEAGESNPAASKSSEGSSDKDKGETDIEGEKETRISSGE